MPRQFRIDSEQCIMPGKRTKLKPSCSLRISNLRFEISKRLCRTGRVERIDHRQPGRYSIWRRNALGGTGVTPVKSGVAPDFARTGTVRIVSRLQSGRVPHDFGRDARNYRLEAGSTRPRYAGAVNRWFRLAFWHPVHLVNPVQNSLSRNDDRMYRIYRMNRANRSLYSVECQISNLKFEISKRLCRTGRVERF
jgi:hypothetical protein